MSLSSSSSSPNPDQKLNTVVETTEEKRAMNNPKLESPQKVLSERRIERPSLGLGVVLEEKDLMEKHTPRDNTGNICKREFLSSNALGDPQNTHKHEEELERRMKKMEPRLLMKPYNSYQGPSNDKLLEIFPRPFKSMGGDGSITCPSVNIGVTGGIVTDKDMTVGHPVTPDSSFIGNTTYDFFPGSPLRSHDYNHHTLSNTHNLGLSLAPNFISSGGGSSSTCPSLLFNGGVTRETTDINMVAPAIPYLSFTENTGFGSFSNDPFQAYSTSPHALSLELSLGPSNPIGSNIDNNNSSHALSNDNNFLVFSIGPPKPRRRNRGLRKLFMRLRPRLDRYLPKYNPIDSITTHIPPYPATNLSNEENVSGSSNSESVISKEEKKIVVLDNDDNEEKPEENEAKSWGRDLSLSF